MSDRALAERLARTAGAIALELRGGAATAKAGATDLVTEADVRAERTLLDLLAAERPHDGVLGEEGAAAEGTSGRRWLLDPVDGTLNYAAGMSPWCSAVALCDAQGPLACAVYDGAHDELFGAARGEGATRDGQRLALTAPAPALADAVVNVFVDARRRDPEIVAATEALLRRAGAVRAIGSGSVELAWLAAGRLHGWVQADTDPWDWAPGALLVAEADGATAVRGRWHLAAADTTLLEAIAP